MWNLLTRKFALLVDLPEDTVIGVGELNRSGILGGSDD